MTIHHVDLGGEPLAQPDPALAMCTGERGLVAIVPAKTTCISMCRFAEVPAPFGVIVETRALEQTAARARIAVPTIDERHKDGLDDPPLRAVLDLLQAEVSHSGLATSLYVDALLAQLLVRVFRAFEGPPPLPAPPTVMLPAAPESGRLARALRYIEEHLHDTISVDDIAQAVDLSAFHFSRAFKRWTGESPHRYLLNVRLEKAQELLLRSDLPLASIATAVGFYDQSHLGAHFKRRFGITPRELRRTIVRVR